MASVREDHTATLLRHPSGVRHGHVLVAGGYDSTSGSSLATAEVYDPAANTWTATDPMIAARDRHAASALFDGRVLVAGGYSTVAGGSIASAEIYDPTTNAWSPAMAMPAPRWGHSAVTLYDGRVLVVGGYDTGTSSALSAASIYNPGTNTWSSAGSMATGRYRSTATSLADGRVLVAGGLDSGGSALSSAEIYSPYTNTWAIAPSMTDARERHTANMLPNGEVMVAGGTDGLSNALDSIEVFDAVANTWAVKAPMTTARYAHSATRLNDGNVLVAGGRTTGGAPTDDAAVYLYATDIWTAAGPMLSDRSEHTGTLTRLTSGAVLVAGGNDGTNSTATAELYGGVMWTAAASMSTVRNSHIAQLITVSGEDRVLVAGGYTTGCPSPTLTASAEVYNPGSDSWSSAGSMSLARAEMEAALTPVLGTERVLVTGGSLNAIGCNGTGAPVANVDLYDPASNTWALLPPPPSLAIARFRHTATRLPNGKVLVTGGNVPGNTRTATAELYDPVMNSWSFAASMSVARADHTATLLASGDVLVAGGYTGNYPNNTAEIYDPDSDTWSPAASMNYTHGIHTATALGDGRVIVASGIGILCCTSSSLETGAAELYDPVANSWSVSGLYHCRSEHSAALPLSGRALVTGGRGCAAYESGEVFVPSGVGPAEWFSTPNMLNPNGRRTHTSTAIPAGPAAGDVLLTGGYGSTFVTTASAELYHSSLESIPVCYAADAAEDCDADGVRNALDCPNAANPDGNNDLAPGYAWIKDGAGAEGATLGCDAVDINDDNNGCTDAVELGANHVLGGQRDRLVPWDFGDMWVPALPNLAGSRNGAITINDVISVLSWIGAANNGPANVNGNDYDSDTNANGVEDGAEYDRSPGTGATPWKLGPPSGAVAIGDAIAVLASIGDHC